MAVPTNIGFVENTMTTAPNKAKLPTIKWRSRVVRMEYIAGLKTTTVAQLWKITSVIIQTKITSG